MQSMKLLLRSSIVKQLEQAFEYMQQNDLACLFNNAKLVNVRLVRLVTDY